MPRPMLPPGRCGRAYLQQVCCIPRNRFFATVLHDAPLLRQLNHQLVGFGKNAMHTFATAAVDQYARELEKTARKTAGLAPIDGLRMADRFLANCANAKCDQKIFLNYKHCPQCGELQPKVG